MESTAVRFATTARVLTNATRALGLTPPGFRSPPRAAGADRTLAGSGDQAVVSVTLRNRPWAAVAADMVEGVVVANGVHGVDASHLRAALWSALDAAALASDPPPDQQARPRQAAVVHLRTGDATAA